MSAIGQIISGDIRWEKCDPTWHKRQKMLSKNAHFVDFPFILLVPYVTDYKTKGDKNFTSRRKFHLWITRWQRHWWKKKNVKVNLKSERNAQKKIEQKDSTSRKNTHTHSHWLHIIVFAIYVRKMKTRKKTTATRLIHAQKVERVLENHITDLCVVRNTIQSQCIE